MKNDYEFSLCRMVICWCLSFVTVFAQADRISFNVMPKPGQVVHLKMSQEMDFEITFDGDPASPLAGMGPMKVTGTSGFAVTQKIGQPNDAGQITSELIYDEVTADMRMNGTALPMDGAMNKFVGKKMSLVRDREGNITDVRLPQDMGISAEAITQMMKNLSANIPKAPLAVGETATMPLDMALPIPVPGVGPLKLEGSNRVRLLAIEKDGNDRLAKFENTTEGKMNSSADIKSPQGGLKMNIEMSLSGSGPMVLNVDKAFVKSSDIQTKFEAVIKMAGERADVRMPNIKISGTMRIKIAGND